ncbi:MAG: zinc ABC transporter substrate-binding protein [Dethiobacter sp.]|nr:zinc ABC transporter substrate-binding protein [Dethiobacter sp.]MBS3983406.1 zinc ABC transporter substrate-binding protein [Dethiobacter sp.]MCL4463213.1 metal ABC transporter substrate-binding protein [Bacillota bacterium]MCL5993144.1 metal ABC transporter substrate-binding protein [Bacillota bacterium]
MKKGYLLFLLLCLGVLFMTGCGEQTPTGGAAIEKKVVYTTFFPLYDFTKKIGGEKIEVVNMVPAGIEPHDWEPSPQLLGSLSEAEMLVSNGLGMEPWLDKVSGSLPASVVVVNASAGIEPLKGAKDHGHDQEKEKDDHAAEEEKHDEMPDPHVWLDPLLALQQARNIATALSSLDPDNATYYFNNLAAFQAEAEALDQAFREGLSGLARREIIVTHLAFAYLSRRYELEQVSISGLSPHIEPSPAQMKEIVAFGRKYDVRYVFDAPLSTSRLATVLAEEIGAQILVLNPLEGLTEQEISAGDDYFSVMRRNLEQLKIALRE